MCVWLQRNCISQTNHNEADSYVYRQHLSILIRIYTSSIVQFNLFIKKCQWWVIFFHLKCNSLYLSSLLHVIKSRKEKAFRCKYQFIISVFAFTMCYYLSLNINTSWPRHQFCIPSQV